MRIDSDGNIEVESELDYEEGLINDYAFTCRPNQIIYTKDLIHCVGLGLIDEVDRIRKRGLMHVFYNQEVIRDGDKGLILPKDIIRARAQRLEEFFGNFRKNDDCKKVFKNPRAILVYIRGIHFGKGNGFENPMANFIREWLKDKNIELYHSEASGNKKPLTILNLDDDPLEVYSKEFAIWNDKIKIGMYNQKGYLLNPLNYESSINTNF